MLTRSIVHPRNGRGPIDVTAALKELAMQLEGRVDAPVKVELYLKNQNQR